MIQLAGMTATLGLSAGEIAWHALKLLGTLGLSGLVIWLVIRIIKQD